VVLTTLADIMKVNWHDGATRVDIESPTKIQADPTDLNNRLHYLSGGSCFAGRELWSSFTQ
jgi:hypothetical protein